ncbi:MAG TPA: Nif3-like dinuclear metal center hexameric protein [Gemmatimonadales bacterium]|nr:Nif3-like dinuclear metal center hexameric protein [Gemmatimonadales bacterium]
MGSPGPAVSLRDLVEYLDQYLRIKDVPDEPNAVNGLQVENSGRVGSIVAAVDASQATIDGVIASLDPSLAPPLVLVHHGLLWDGNAPVTGRRYRRLAGLLDHDIALYAAHIPLDVHPEVGNNAVLAERLGIRVEGWFGDYRGIEMGVWGPSPSSLPTRESVALELDRVLHTLKGSATLIPGGPEKPSRIGIITGGAGSMIRAARDAGLDTFITGEGPHHTYFDAMEWGVNVIYAGHYATETLGVQAMASHLAEQFDLEWDFHDHPTGL